MECKERIEGRECQLETFLKLFAVFRECDKDSLYLSDPVLIFGGAETKINFCPFCGKEIDKYFYVENRDL